MTKISYVSGIAPTGQNTAAADYLLKGEAPVKGLDLGVFDYLQMTEGEATLQLLKKQAMMYAASYPSLRINWKGVFVNPYTQAQAIIDDAIYNGLHLNFDSSDFNRLANATAGHFDGLVYAAKTAAAAYYPATDMMLYRDRTNAGQGTDPSVQIGEIISLENCQRWERLMNWTGGETPTVKKMFSKETFQMEWFAQTISDADCQKRLEYRDAFNKYLPDSAPQLLYHFVTDAFLRGGVNPLDAVSLANVVNKKAWHSGGVEMFSNVSTLSTSVLTEWLKTGIMAAHQKQGIAPLTPEEALMSFRDDPESWNRSLLGDESRGYRIGEPITLTTLIIIAIAVFLAGGLVQIFQGKEPTAWKYALDLFQKVISPSGTDWKPSGFPTGGTGTNTGGGVTCPVGYTKNAAGLCVPTVTTPTASSTISTKTMVLIGGGVAAAAGLYLLSDNKKA